MRNRGLLVTDRPDDIPSEEWSHLLLGQGEALNRAFARLWIVLFIRPNRRLVQWLAR